jgi:multidrug efflux pump subunit AcrA (membrane-fusion protein)
MQVNAKIFGGKLEKLIKNYERLAGEKAAAQDALQAAEAEVKAAKEAGLQATIRAKLDGTAAEGSSRIEEAEVALRAARYDFDATGNAVLAARDLMAAEATKPEYAERLEKALEAPRMTALNHLTALEAAVDEMRAIKGHQNWRVSPTKGGNVMDVIEGNVFTTATNANGTPVAADDQLLPLRRSLEGKKLAPSTQNDWGIPVGALLSGPFRGVEAPINGGNVSMTGGAARAFDEFAGGDLDVKRIDPGTPAVPAPEPVPA